MALPPYKNIPIGYADGDSFLFLLALVPENDLTGVSIHAVHDRQRFQPVTQIADHLSAYLETLFHSDTNAFHGGTCLVADGDQALERTAVGQEIVNDQHMVIGSQELL